MRKFVIYSSINQCLMNEITDSCFTCTLWPGYFNHNFHKITLKWNAITKPAFDTSVKHWQSARCAVKRTAPLAIIAGASSPAYRHSGRNQVPGAAESQQPVARLR